MQLVVVCNGQLPSHLSDLVPSPAGLALDEAWCSCEQNKVLQRSDIEELMVLL